MKNTKRIVAILGAILISVSCVSPIHAATGTSIAPEIMNQSKGLASLITSRIHVLWSDYVNKQLEYTNNPEEADLPQWATSDELEDMIGGTAPEGLTFEEVDMPADRDDSFYLKITVGSQHGGAAAARYIKAYLPTATVENNIITVPVTRPSQALGLADLHLTEFWDVTRFEMAYDREINVNYGDIINVANMDSDHIETNTINIATLLTGNNAEYSGYVNVGGDVSIDGKLTVGNGGNGHIYLGADGHIHGSTDDTLTIAGDNNTSMLAKLVIYADSTQFRGDIELDEGEIKLVKDGAEATLGFYNGNFRIDSDSPILISQAGTTILDIAEDEVKINAPLTVAGDILPAADGTYNLGSDSLVWNNVYTNSVKNGSGVYIDLDSNQVRIGKDEDDWLIVKSDGIYDGSGNQLATQAFVNSAIASSSLKGTVLNWKTLSPSSPSSRISTSTTSVACSTCNYFSLSSLSNEFYAQYGHNIISMEITCSVSSSCSGGQENADYRCWNYGIAVFKNGSRIYYAQPARVISASSSPQSLNFTIDNDDSGTYYFMSIAGTSTGLWYYAQNPATCTISRVYY